MTDDEYFNFIATSGPEIQRRIMEEVMTKDLPDKEIIREADNIKTEVRQTTKAEMFGWGDFRRDHEEKWKILKNNNVVKIPVTTPIVWLDENDKRVSGTEKEMELYNNEAMMIYADDVIDYLRSGDVAEDKEDIDPLTGQSAYEKEVSNIWSDAKADAKATMIERREK